MRTILAAAAVLVAATPCFADCAPSVTEGVSSNGRFKAVPKLDGSFAFYERADASQEWTKAHGGKVELPGHHVTALVADDGEHVVLHDKYGGIAVHEPWGKLVRRWTPETLLTEAEAKDRPRKWECHPEGEWSAGVPTFVEGKLRVTLHSGRAVDLDPWVGEGECATPDQAKTHGVMNCIGAEWTCPRCHKKRSELRWRVCTDCCKKLSVCVVCNKRAKR